MEEATFTSLEEIARFSQETKEHAEKGTPKFEFKFDDGTVREFDTKYAVYLVLYLATKLREVSSGETNWN